MEFNQCVGKKTKVQCSSSEITTGISILHVHDLHAADTICNQPCSVNFIKKKFTMSQSEG